MSNIPDSEHPRHPLTGPPDSLVPAPVRAVLRDADTEIRVRSLPAPRGVDLRLYRRSAGSQDPADFHATAAGLVVLPGELRTLAAHLLDLAGGGS